MINYSGTYLKNLKISIACCTYNGERFLKQQLDSMLIQTVLPSELIVCDDGSSDRTIEILERFADIAPFSVKAYKNDAQPLGSTKNFEKAISLCKGDIIVLSDQDDVWMPNKLALLQKAISDGAGLVFSDAELVDENLKPFNYSLFGSFDLSRKEKNQMAHGYMFDVLMRRNIVTGATAAFSRQHLALILPISNNWIHDAWIALLIASVDKITVIQQPLIKYRQHNKNQIGAKKLNYEEKINRVKKLGNLHYKELLNGFVDTRLRLLSCYPEIIGSRIILLLDMKIIHLTKRSKLADPSLFPFFSLTRELLTSSYHKFSRGYITYFRDLTMMVLNKIDR